MSASWSAMVETNSNFRSLIIVFNGPPYLKIGTTPSSFDPGNCLTELVGNELRILRSGLGKRKSKISDT